MTEQRKMTWDELAKENTRLKEAVKTLEHELECEEEEQEDLVDSYLKEKAEKEKLEKKLKTMIPIHSIDAALKEAFMEGFSNAVEGYNGEYPFHGDMNRTI